MLGCDAWKEVLLLGARFGLVGRCHILYDHDHDYRSVLSIWRRVPRQCRTLHAGFLGTLAGYRWSCHGHTNRNVSSAGSMSKQITDTATTVSRTALRYTFRTCLATRRRRRKAALACPLIRPACEIGLHELFTDVSAKFYGFNGEASPSLSSSLSTLSSSRSSSSG